jgi:hypothetical protein
MAQESNNKTRASEGKESTKTQNNRSEDAHERERGSKKNDYNITYPHDLKFI